MPQTEAGANANPRPKGDDMKTVLRSHFARYPAMTPQDGVKLVYQSAFGPGHLLADPDRARAFLHRELAETPSRAGEIYEPIGNGYARLHLGAAKAAGLAEEEIFQAFFGAANGETPGKETFEQGLSLLEDLTTAGEAPFSAAELTDYLAEYRAAGCPMVSHSPVYREHYHPAYRVVKQKME